MSALDDFPGLADAQGGAFYLHGDDHFRKEQAVRGLIEAHLDPGTRDFNYDPLRGTEVDAETLASVIATPPMMAEWRVVVVREVEGLAGSKKAREVLLAAATSPPPGLALIMSCTVPEKSKARIYRDLERAARALELEALSENDVPGWLLARAEQAHGLKLEQDAARALGAALGSELGALSQELHKLASFVGDRGAITLADVQAAGTSLLKQDRWRWFDLVGERRFEDAIRGLPILLSDGESPVGLVIALATHMLRLGVAVEQGASGLERVVPPYQRWLAKPISRQARGWTIAEVDDALAGLLDVDRLLKASGHTGGHFLEAWLLGLTVTAEAA